MKIRKDLRISRCNNIGGKWKKLLNRRFAHVYPKERKGVMSLKQKIEGKMRLKEKRKVEQMYVFVYCRGAVVGPNHTNGAVFFPYIVYNGIVY